MIHRLEFVVSHQESRPRRVALIDPRSGNPAKANLVWPPLGLCRIARYLSDRGHEVKIVEDALKKVDGNTIRVAVADAEFIGLGAMTLHVPRVEQIIAEIRQYSNAVIVCGGSHYSAVKKVPAGGDAVVVGDGESAFLSILNGSRGVIHGEPAEEFIPADFSPIDYQLYGDHLIDGTRAISILTSRGCPFGCKFCGSPQAFGRGVTDYHLEKVVANMVELSNRYGIKAFRIMDDTFTLNSMRVAQFCDMIAPYGWRMSCLTNVRAIKLPTLKKMKEAGFDFVAIGAESGNDEMLTLADKPQGKEDIRRAVRMINEAGLRAEVLWMMGLPGETVESMEETFNLARELEAFRTHAQFFTPFPGSDFADEIDKYGIVIEPDYGKWNHRDPVFVPNTISLDALIAGGNRFFEHIGRRI